MANLQSKIVLLLVKIATAIILIVQMLQIRDISSENVMKIILNLTLGVYIILSIFVVSINIALLMKKNLDILVNISGVFSMISLCVFFYLAQITDILHENYKYIFVGIDILTMIISIVNGLVYYKKLRKN